MIRPRSEAEAVAALQYAIKAVGSQKAFCDANDLSESQVSAVLNGRADLSAKVAASIGLRPITVYERVTP